MARPEGSSNRNKQFLLSRLQAMYGDEFHPIMSMAKNAHEFQQLLDGKEGDPEFRGRDLIEANKLWEGIAQYVEPKLKSVEVSGNPDSPLELKSPRVTDEQLAAIIANTSGH
jgi:hypothetical protein